MLTCAKSPCKSCPYRRDVPSGVWAKEEYDKLPAYDGEIIDQLRKEAYGRFDCHQRDGHLCAGWVAAHGAGELLALRMQANKIDPSVWSYRSPVPVFSSGKEAAEHGKRDLDNPTARSKRMVKSLLRRVPEVKL